MDYPVLRDLVAEVERLEDQIEAQRTGASDSPFLSTNEAVRQATDRIGFAMVGRSMRRPSGEASPEAKMVLDEIRRPVPPGSLAELKALLRRSIALPPDESR